MAAKTPLKATFDGSSNVTGLAEFVGADFVAVADGGTGVATITSGGVVVGAGTSAVTSNKAAPSGDFVGTTDTQTLTNKTLTTPTITTPVINAGADFKNGATSAGFIKFFEDSDNGTNAVTLIGPASTADVTLTLPAATDTLVGKATTDTLTNKTLTAPALTSPTVTTSIDLLARAEIRFKDADSSHYIGFEAPATVSSNLIWTLPATDGSGGQVLKTDGSGGLGWVSASGGGSGSSFPNSTIQTLPGKSSDYDLSFNAAQNTQETPFDSGATDAFGVNLGTVFSLMDPIGTVEGTGASDGGLDLGAFS